MTSPTGVWCGPPTGRQRQKAWFPAALCALPTRGVVWRWRASSTTKVGIHGPGRQGPVGMTLALLCSRVIGTTPCVVLQALTTVSLGHSSASGAEVEMRISSVTQK